MSKTQEPAASQAVQKKKGDDHGITAFVPFGSRDEIKLSVAIVQRLVATPTKSGKFPSENDCLKFIAMCKAMQLNPFVKDVFLVGYDSNDKGPQFSMITAHQALLKRAEVNDDYDGMESGVVIMGEKGPEDRLGDFHLPDEKVVGGWARVFFKQRSHPTYRRLSLAQRMPKFVSDFWNENKKAEQIVKCAEADALRSSFPTTLGGLYIKEEGARDETTGATVQPIFKTDSKVVDVTSHTQEQECREPNADSVDKLTSLIKEAGIKEGELMKFLKESALAESEDSKLTDLDTETVNTVINQWEEFEVRIKESSD